jgi:malate/lactate dehydrogenase
LEIAEYVRKTTQKNDKVLVIGNGSNILSYFLADYKQYPFAQSMYFMGDLNIDSYKKIMEKELNEAEILIFNTFDAHTDISGNVESSFELIQKDIQYNSILNNQFHYEITFDNFIIYRKNP